MLTTAWYIIQDHYFKEFLKGCKIYPLLIISNSQILHKRTFGVSCLKKFVPYYIIYVCVFIFKCKSFILIIIKEFLNFISTSLINDAF